VSTAARVIASILVAGSLLAACGDDDEATSGDEVPAVAPAADTAFDGLKTGLEAEGLMVADLPAASLSNGAETGVNITGDRTGTARLFPSQAEADAYAQQAEQSGDATTTVGTVVFQSDSQEDADFFAATYEGG
jgi:hypothetical protein